MKLVDTTCPSCGANLSVDQENAVAFCQYCGARLLVDDEVRRTRLDDAEETGYLFELGRQRAIAEARSAQGTPTAPDPNVAASESMPAQSEAAPAAMATAPAPKGRRTWLWVLGWLFFFPLPLAILVMRHFETDPDVEIDAAYVFRALGWVLGWVYVFPIPLTILMLRNDSLPRPARIAISAAGWILYLAVFILPARS